MKLFAPILAISLAFAGCNIDPNQGQSAPQKTATKPVEEPKKVEETKQTEPVNTLPSAKRIFKLADLQKAKIKGSGPEVDAWVMDTTAKHEEGLMYLGDKELGPDSAMIFVFPDEAPRGFWMENTLVPLDIVFVDKSGKVLNIGHGKPLKTDSIRSNGNAKYVIEFKEGQATKLGFGPGTKVVIPANLAYVN